VKVSRAKLIYWSGIAVVIVLLVVVIATWPSRKEQPQAERPVPVSIITLSPEQVEDVVRLPGWILPIRESRVATEKGGRVAALSVREGDSVTEGQVLLQLESGVWSNMQLKAQIQLRDAERELKRLQVLSESGAVSQSDFDKVSAMRDSARIDMAQATLEMTRCQVRSPFDGIVNTRRVEIGEFAPEGGFVFHLVQTDRVKVSVDVPERDVATLKTGDNCIFRVLVLPDRVFTGTVSFVAAAAGEESHSYRLEMESANTDSVLKPGMVAEVDIVRGTIGDAVVIPLASVVPYKGEHVVFVVSDGKAVRRKVQLGAMLPERVVVKAGLSPGEVLIVDGMRGLEDGRAVATVVRQDR